MAAHVSMNDDGFIGKDLPVSRHQQHPLLQKIASRRRRLEGADYHLRHFEMVELSSKSDRTRHPPLLAERILTHRETEVLLHVARGDTDKQIADRLFLSRRTVSNHVSNILDKLGVANRRDAVRTALRIGLI